MNIEQMLRDAIERKEDLIKFIVNAHMIEPSYAEALVNHVPSVIVRDFTKKAAMTDDGFISAEWNDEYGEYVTHYEEGDDYDDVPASMLDERHMKFAKPNMPTHWMKMPTHP